MKKLTLALLVAAFLTGGAFAEGNKYGKPLKLKDKTKISAILEKPKSFVGKTVQVEGVVLDVCKKRGCWMEIAGDKPGTKIKVKVDDGVIVFPMEEKGKTALVEGKVYEIKFTKEEAVERAQHHAEEQGLKFDPKTVKGPLTIYQIKGQGAVIK